MKNIANKISNAFSRLMQDERGTQLVETAVWIGMITALVVATVTAIGTDVQTAFTSVSNVFNPVLQTAPAAGG